MLQRIATNTANKTKNVINIGKMSLAAASSSSSTRLTASSSSALFSRTTVRTVVGGPGVIAPPPSNDVRFAGPITHNQHTKHMTNAIGQLSSIIVDRAEGSYIYGKDGKKYLDLCAGIGVNNLGHAHPKVNAAAIEQIKKGNHLQLNCVTGQSVIDLSNKMGKILPPNFPKDYQVLFANSGAEAIENTLKIARLVTGRQTIISFQGSFHGRTIGAGSITNSKYVYRSGFQPAMAGVFVAPFPYCYRCPVAQASGGKNCETNCCQQPTKGLRDLIKTQTGSDEVAAVIIEPFLGEGGYVIPPKQFLKDVRAFCTEIGALMVADEVQTGYGRSGTYFACEQFDVIPDLLVTAKGIANGYPLSAVVGSGQLMSRVRQSSVGGTYSGSVVSCAAGSAVIDVMTEPGFLENVNARGEQLRAGLRDLQKKNPHFMIGDVRGAGLWNAIEFKDDAKTAGITGKLVKAAEKNELLIMSAGMYETIRFICPLNITKEEVNEALTKLEKSLNDVLPK